MGKPTNPIEIFRAGRHVTADGARLEFTEEQLQACVDSYDTALHEAPIVIGHPKADLPAYGWVSGLSLDGGVLSANPSQVDPAFAELVDKGRFKKISASFYAPDSEVNPKPGTWYLRHVGFLGAEPPAVKGLKNASFADGGKGVVNFMDWDDMQNASLWRRLREWFIGEKGQDTADQVIPGYVVDQLQQSAAAESDADQTLQPAFRELRTTYLTPKEPLMAGKDPAAQTAEFAERERVIGAREAAIAAREADALKADWTNFCEGLVRDGKLTPAQRVHVMTLATQLPATVQVAEFTEGGVETKRPALQVFRDLIALLPKQVEFREVARPDGKSAQVDLTDAPALARAAQDFQESERQAGRSVSIERAVEHVVAQHEGAAQ
jgi:hypothetical protein